MLYSSKITKFFLLFIIFVEFLLFRYLLSNSFIFADDPFSSLLYLDFNIFANPHMSHPVSSILGRIFSTFIPLIFSIHPSAVKSVYFSFFASLVVFYFVYILNNLLFQKKNADNIVFQYSCFLSSFAFVLYFVQQQPYLFFIYDGLFRMFIPPFLLLLLFHFLLKTDEELFKKRLLVIFIIFIASLSSEMICFIMFVGLILFYLVDISRKQDKRMNILYFSFILSSMLSFAILYKMGAFLRKTPNMNVDFQFFISIINSLPEFFILYFKKIVFDHFYGLMFLIIQILFLYYRRINDYLYCKAKNLILCFFFATLFFFFSLILLGKSHYFSNYWLIHDDLHVMFNIIICGFNFILFSFVIEHKFISDKVILKVVFLLIVLLNLINFKFYNSFLKEKIIPLKIETYRTEKIIRLATINNEIPIIKDVKASIGIYCLNYNHLKYYSSFFSYDFIFDLDYWYYKGDKYKFCPYISYLNKFEDNNKLKNKVIISDENYLLQDFKMYRESFTKEELENIDFNKLRDKKFLLKGK